MSDEKRAEQKLDQKDRRKLDEKEESAVEERVSLRAPLVYEIISRDGEEELIRPMASLWWSGVAAGICLSTSVFVESFLHYYLPDRPWRPLAESLGYSFGFLLVILGGLQLFTENTITVILPLLARPTRRNLVAVLRLWAVVLLANLVGTLLSAALAVHGGIATDAQLGAALDLARHYVEYTPLEMLLRGVPAGFLIAALVWMLPSSRGSEFWVITTVTYVIALGGLTHVIAGSTEVFLLTLTGELGVPGTLFGVILPTLVGNIVGGTVLFSLLAYGQVSSEI
ncbi:Formate/nitrite transporter FocA, FNT family [Tistlia consotensis]|uniref:Formate/nitrite transporter FocA, FNT family n=1 Tax=Tistlia consotensis USBA 355 TaxID=560819 RepID=A0A1Y6BPG7_9PROT|nr:formate/nitrite transporter family protein [Tistlia consotensis]SMF21806.1 Formate/nitrite transporter FocA, FNT family [Tistlia consotensis USBA 355]SNR46553.1 Formate/nitrite transporter FocA, FNT family [Tistlia consotensis]